NGIHFDFDVNFATDESKRCAKHLNGDQTGYEQSVSGAVPCRTLILNGSAVAYNNSTEQVFKFKNKGTPADSIPIERVKREESDKSIHQFLPTTAWAFGSTSGILYGESDKTTCTRNGETASPEDSIVSAIGFSKKHIMFLSSDHNGKSVSICDQFRAHGITDAAYLDSGDSAQLVVDGELKNPNSKYKDTGYARHVAFAIGLVAVPVIESVTVWKDGSQVEFLSPGDKNVVLEVYGKNLAQNYTYSIYPNGTIKNLLVLYKNLLVWLGLDNGNGISSDPKLLQGLQAIYQNTFKDKSLATVTLEDIKGLLQELFQANHVLLVIEEVPNDANGWYNLKLTYGNGYLANDSVVKENAFEIRALPEQPKQPEAPNCTFSDLTQLSSEFADAIQALCQKGIVQGNLNTSGQHVYRPLDNATLAETLKILVYASDYERIHNDKARVDSNPQYFLQDAAQRKPPVTIVDETFLNGSIVREKTMEYLAKLFYHYEGSTPVDFLVNCKITNGSEPKRLLHRDELALLAYRAMQIKECLPN
ncbi:MAG: hypothetical protein BWK78_04685, partial [Thiotrichaceae bacterium IS1]